MVGFRLFVQRRAAELGLVGYVRNTLAGEVEVVAEGPRGRLESLLRDLRRGPRGAAVEEVGHEWGAAAGGFRFFRISY